MDTQTSFLANGVASKLQASPNFKAIDFISLITIATTLFNFIKKCHDPEPSKSVQQEIQEEYAENGNEYTMLTKMGVRFQARRALRHCGVKPTIAMVNELASTSLEQARTADAVAFQSAWEEAA